MKNTAIAPGLAAIAPAAITLTAIILAAIALAGCNQLPGFGVSSPHRKPGLWEQTFQGDQSPTPIVTRACFDAASDRQMPVLPRKSRRMSACQKFSVTKTSDGYVIDIACAMPGGASITRHSVISGDFSSRYTVTSAIDIANSPTASRNGHHTATVTDVYKGDCPSDIQPGQVELPNGDVVSMASLRGGRGEGGGERGGGPAPTNAAPPGGNSAPSGANSGDNGGGGPPQ